MLQRNEKGKQARQYFIQLEKTGTAQKKLWREPLKLQIKNNAPARTKNAQQKQQIIAELNPKASYLMWFCRTKDAISASQIARDYGKAPCGSMTYCTVHL